MAAWGWTPTLDEESPSTAPVSVPIGSEPAGSDSSSSVDADHKGALRSGAPALSQASAFSFWVGHA